MKKRITQVTTKGGDAGTSSLADGTRLAKTHPRFEAIGTIDELNSFAGLLLVQLQAESSQAANANFVQDIQQALFDLGGALAFPGSDKFPTPELLEEAITTLNAALAPLTEFVLPGGTQGSALAHVCRTVCRRAERCMWALAEDEANDGSKDTVPGAAYLNRLSDYFFVLARTLNEGTTEQQWRGPAQPNN